MRLKEAIEYLNKTMSKYAIAKDIGVAPIMIDKYLNGSKINAKKLKAFKKFDIKIDEIDVIGK